MANNLVRMQETFTNLAQVKVEDWAAITNLMATNSIFTDQVELYTNHLYLYSTNNNNLQRSVQNLQGKVKNLKHEPLILKNSSYK